MCVCVCVCVCARALMYGVVGRVRKRQVLTLPYARACVCARVLSQAQRLPGSIVGISPAIDDKHAPSPASG